MQKRPLAFHPVHGAKQSISVTAAEFRFNNGRTHDWHFNPWTGKVRDIGSVKSDPFGLLIHDGESPVKAWRGCPKEECVGGVGECATSGCKAARAAAGDTPAAAREALHDWAEKEATHPRELNEAVARQQQVADCAKEAFDKTFGPQPGPARHPLQYVFALAIEQATRGKGVRHGGEATPFLDQPWVHYGKMHGRGFLTGQGAKKLEEAASLRQGDAFITEALGALVYIGMAILKEQGKA